MLFSNCFELSILKSSELIFTPFSSKYIFETLDSIVDDGIQIHKPALLIDTKRVQDSNKNYRLFFLEILRFTA